MIDRSEWYTSAELAGLPGLPSTDRRVRARADREAWQSRERAGRGGGREYHVSALPDAARAELLLRARRAERQARVAAGIVAPEPTDLDRVRLPQGFDIDAIMARLTERQRTRVAEQVARLFEVEDLVEADVPRLIAYEQVAAAHGLKARTLRHWYDRVKRLPRHAWAAALVDQRTGCSIEADYDERVYQDFRDRYLQPNAVATKVYQQTTARAKAEGWGYVPSVDTLLRHLQKREDPLVIVYEREGEKALRDRLPHMRRDVSALRALEILNVDGHYADLLVSWPDGEVTRPCLIGVQDVHSRAYVGWRICKSETAHDLRLALLHAIESYGLPGEVRFDNTFAAAAKQNTGGASVTGRKRFRSKAAVAGAGASVRTEIEGILPLCGIKVGFVQVAHGQSKPIERSFREIAEQVASWPGFRGAQTGSSPATKPHDAGQRVIPIADVTKVLEHFIALWNTTAGRRGSVAAGRSYWQLFEGSYQAHAASIARPTAEQLRLLKLVPTPAYIRATGHVEFRGNLYWSAVTMARAGEHVVLRYDATGDLHQGVWLYTRDGKPLGHVPCVHTGGFRTEADNREFLRSREQMQRAAKRLADTRRRYEAAELGASVPLEAVPALPPSDVVRLAGGLALPELEPRPMGHEPDGDDAMTAALLDFTAAYNEQRARRPA